MLTGHVNIPSCSGCVTWAVTHRNCKLPTTCRHCSYLPLGGQAFSHLCTFHVGAPRLLLSNRSVLLRCRFAIRSLLRRNEGSLETISAASRYIYGPAHAVKGLSNGKHASEQMQSSIRPLSEDLPWSSGPDEICASSPHHDRGLRGPVPTQVRRKPV